MAWNGMQRHAPTSIRRGARMGNVVCHTDTVNGWSGDSYKIIQSCPQPICTRCSSADCEMGHDQLNKMDMIMIWRMFQSLSHEPLIKVAGLLRRVVVFHSVCRCGVEWTTNPHKRYFNSFLQLRYISVMSHVREVTCLMKDIKSSQSLGEGNFSWRVGHRRDARPRHEKEILEWHALTC